MRQIRDTSVMILLVEQNAKKREIADCSYVLDSGRIMNGKHDGAGVAQKSCTSQKRTWM